MSKRLTKRIKEDIVFKATREIRKKREATIDILKKEIDLYFREMYPKCYETEIESFIKWSSELYLNVYGTQYSLTIDKYPYSYNKTNVIEYSVLPYKLQDMVNNWLEIKKQHTKAVYDLNSVLSFYTSIKKLTEDFPDFKKFIVEDPQTQNLPILNSTLENVKKIIGDQK